MKKISLLILALLAIAGPALAVQPTFPTYIVIGDSIESFAGDGQSKDLDLTIVSSERNVVFKNLSTPGLSLGAAAPGGFNSTNTFTELDQICGYLYTACDGFLIEAGTNDFANSVPWSQTSASLTNIINYAAAHGKKVLMLDLIWRSDENVGNSQLDANGNHLTLYNYRIGRQMICASHASVCTYAARPADFDAPSTTLYTASEVTAGTQTHPNVAGHRIRANWIESAAAGAGLF